MTALLLFNGAGSGALGGAVPRDAVKNLGLVSFGDPPGSTTGDGSTPVAGVAKEGEGREQRRRMSPPQRPSCWERHCQWCQPSWSAAS